MTEQTEQEHVLTEHPLVAAPADLPPQLDVRGTEPQAVRAKVETGWLVCVPRGAVERWWVRPWSDVAVAALAGEDGLAPHARGQDVPPDFALLREGWRPGITCLHVQNW